MAHRAGHGKSLQPGQVMTVDQVAAYLQLNRLTVYRYVREGKIPASKIGKLYRILRADIDLFLEAQKVGGPAARRRTQKVATAPAPKTAATPRPASSDEIYVGPQWRERLRDKDQTVLTRYPLEWTLRGLH